MERQRYTNEENGVIMMRDDDLHCGEFTPSARGKDEPSAYVLTPPIAQSRSSSGLLYCDSIMVSLEPR